MKASRKIIPALAMLIVSAVVMTSASYAWFTMSKEVSANDMKVTVTAPNNLLIAGKDDADFTNFTAAGHDSSIGGMIVYPASSVDGLNFFSVEDNSAVSVAAATDGQLLHDSALKADTTAANGVAAGAYADFKYVLKTDGASAVNVQVNSIELTFDVEGNTFAMDAAGAITLKTPAAVPTGDGVVYAVDDTNTGKFIKTTYTGGVAGPGEDNQDVAVAGLKAVRFAVLTGETTGVAAYDAGGLCVYGAWGDNWVDGKAIDAINLTDNIAVTDVKSAAVNTATAPTAPNGTNVFQVPANGTTQTITVRVWLEGEDEACTVSKAAGMNFGLNLVLRDAAYVG